MNQENPTGPERRVNEIIQDHNFVILGVSQMENKIIKGQQYINALNLAMKIPNIANIPLLWEKVWGVIGDGDARVCLPQPTDPSMDPNDENVLLTQGADVLINPNDNDQQHMAAHMPLQLIPEFMPNKIKHVQSHMAAMQKKQAIAAMAAQGAPGQQLPAFAPKPPMPGNNGLPPGIVAPPPAVAGPIGA